MISTQQRIGQRRWARAGSLLRAFIAAALVVPAFLMLGAASADAAAYRYWSFWVASDSGTWSYASVGPASTRPQDGQVQGWRFAVSVGANSSTITPRASGSFASLCAGQPAVADRKRVGLVIDFGTRADAPPGESPPALRTFCVLAPLKASGAAVLQQALSVRSQDGLICGINGYPRSECAVVVEAPRPEPAPTSKPRPSARPTPSQRSSDAPKSPTPISITASDEANQSTTASSPTPAPRAVSTSDPDASGAAGSTTTTQPPISATPTVITDAAPVATGAGDASPWGVVVALILLALAAGSAAVIKRRA